MHTSKTLVRRQRGETEDRGNLAKEDLPEEMVFSLEYNIKSRKAR
jgi:hypothetical protein